MSVHAGDPFQAVIPLRTFVKSDRASALYVAYQYKADYDDRTSPDVFRISMPLTKWVAATGDADAWEELERCGLADVAPSHVRLRTINHGGGSRLMWVLPGDDMSEVFAKAEQAARDEDNEPVKRTSQAKRRPGYVYVMAKSDSGPFKIGRSVDVDARLRSINNMNPEPLSVIRTWPVEDMKSAESALHEHLAMIRIHGEWFEATLDDLDAAAFLTGVATLDDLDATGFLTGVSS